MQTKEVLFTRRSFFSRSLDEGDLLALLILVPMTVALVAVAALEVYVYVDRDLTLRSGFALLNGALAATYFAYLFGWYTLVIIKGINKRI